MDIKFEIEKCLGVLSTSKRGWTTELNLISWNGREPKVDIREWDENHDVAGKGLTLTKTEEMELCSILHEHLKGANNDILGRDISILR